MLYDPKWNEVNADAFSLGNLIAWLEKQPANEKYCFRSNGDCLFARYFISCGFGRVSMSSTTLHWGAIYEHARVLPYGWDDLAADRPHTFGSALARARALSKG